jgi:hypothetical protein
MSTPITSYRAESPDSFTRTGSAPSCAAVGSGFEHAVWSGPKDPAISRTGLRTDYAHY